MPQYNRNSLNICQVNVRSLCAQNRLLDLEILSAQHSFDVLCLTETWLTPSRNSASISLPGYQSPFRRDRSTGANSGGVAIYVATHLPVTLVQLPGHIDIEIVCVRIHLKRKSLIILTA